MARYAGAPAGQLTPARRGPRFFAMRSSRCIVALRDRQRGQTVRSHERMYSSTVSSPRQDVSSWGSAHSSAGWHGGIRRGGVTSLRTCKSPCESLLTSIQTTLCSTADIRARHLAEYGGVLRDKLHVLACHTVASSALFIAGRDGGRSGCRLRSLMIPLKSLSAGRAYLH